MSAIHQPAPWSRDKYGNLVDANGESVYLRGVATLCAGSDDRIAMAEANTELLTVAPQLLLALADAEEILRGLFSELPSVRSRVDAYANLIAKARGAS